MSETQELLDVDTAYQLVHHQVYAPVFFEKLASDHNLVPQSDEEAMSMLTMAGQLREAHEQSLQKTGADQQSVLSAAGQHLNGALANAGYDFAGPNNAQIEKVAASAASNPEIAHAVLSLQAGAAGITKADLSQRATAQPAAV